MIVAIDGPAGAGKSTVARALAKRLGHGYLDSGAIYRAITWLAQRDGIALDDAAAVTRLAMAHPVRVEVADDGNRVAIAGQDVTELIRTPVVSAGVSQVAAHPGVRTASVEAQRAIMAEGSWVCDGRDIGTVVWPQAEVKFFLVATPEERARRRHDELITRGNAQELDDVLADITRRDHIDSTRSDSPLRKADDAVEVDTTSMEIEQVVELLASMTTQSGAKSR